MMTLSVAEDFAIPETLRLSSWYKGLFIASILIPTITLTISLSQLAAASRYTTPVASGLTALHSATLWFLCRQETLRDPSIAPRRRRRMPTTRRLALGSTLALEVFWIVVIVLLVIYITSPRHTIPESESSKDDSSDGEKGGLSWDRARVLAVVELVFVGIQACVTLTLGVRCWHERISVLRPSTQRTGQRRRVSFSSRWFHFR